MIKMTKEMLLNHGLEYNEKTFLRDFDKIIAKAEENIRNGNVREAKLFFKDFEEGKYSKLLQSDIECWSRRRFAENLLLYFLYFERRENSFKDNK